MSLIRWIILIGSVGNRGQLEYPDTTCSLRLKLGNSSPECGPYLFNPEHVGIISRPF